MNSFYNTDELHALGLKSFGRNVLISRKSSIYNPDAITIGDNVRIDDFCILSGGKNITIGSYIHISAFAAIYGGGGVVMDDFSTLSARVTVYSICDDFSGASLTNPMLPQKYKPGYICKPVRIGRHVVCGAGTIILPGVTLHEGVAVGAASLVTRDCKEWNIYGGNPARILKPRSRDVLELEQRFLAERGARRA